MSEVSYAYHANALGIGGVINGPTRKVIPSLAATVLAPTGGLGSSIVSDYNQHGVSFTTAYSMVRGDIDSNGDFRTEAEVTIDNLDVLDTLHVDRMRATVTSLRNPADNEARITFHAEYHGVFNGSDQILPDVDLDLFTNYPTYDSFLGEVASDRDKYKAMFGWPDDEASTIDDAIKSALNPRGLASPSAMQSLRASMVRGLKTKHDAQAYPGNIVRVPGVGKVHFAEVLLKPGRRRLTLLQIDLDRPAQIRRRSVSSSAAFESRASTAGIETLGAPAPSSGGTMTMASLEGNGTLIWPKQGG